MVCLVKPCTSVEGRFESLLSDMHSTDSAYSLQAQPRVTSPYTLDNLVFILPPELISQHPAIKRSAAKVLHCRFAVSSATRAKRRQPAVA